jgi:hypothetical protein
MIFLLPLFSLSPSLKHVLSLQKFIKVWSFVNFITFYSYFFDCIKINLFVFQFHLLTFDFFIKFSHRFFFVIWFFLVLFLIIFLFNYIPYNLISFYFYINFGPYYFQSYFVDCFSTLPLIIWFIDNLTL